MGEEHFFIGTFDISGGYVVLAIACLFAAALALIIGESGVKSKKEESEEENHDGDE